MNAHSFSRVSDLFLGKLALQIWKMGRRRREVSHGCYTSWTPASISLQPRGLPSETGDVTLPFLPAPEKVLNNTVSRWEAADDAASRALLHDPKHVKALYRRALARKELSRYCAAETGRFAPSRLAIVLIGSCCSFCDRPPPPPSPRAC